MLSYAAEMRRKFHMCPEIGFDLTETLALLRAELDKIGVPYTEKYGKSSIVATVNEEKSRYTIGIRADIDALPMKEENDVPYKSRHEGKMHACGHDAHCAVALATLAEIYRLRDKINCRVKFIFQSAEEYTTSGARLMAEDGVMDGIDCIAALHCDPIYTAGQVGFRNGAQGAISDGILLEFFGKSTHAAFQQGGVDAIMMAVRAYSDIEFMIAKELPAVTPVIFNAGKIEGGKTNNIIADYCKIYCTLRTHTEDVEEKALRRIREICEYTAKCAGGSAKFTHVKHYPIVYNDERVTDKMRAAAAKVVGEKNVLPKMRTMGGEDFSYFAMRKPGCMMRLGVTTPGKPVTGLHQTTFDIDESALDIGVEVFKTFILDNMNG